MEQLRSDFFSLETQKKQALEKLCDGAPDAIYVLSSNAQPVESPSGEQLYKPGGYHEKDWNGYMAGALGRVLASAELAHAFPNAVVAANSSTYNRRDPNAPKDADVIAEYLKEESVPEERIIRQYESASTFGELVELAKYIAEKKWQHPVVIAGEPQVARAEEMLKQLGTLQDPAGVWEDPKFREALTYLDEHKPKITVVSAEAVLPLRDSKYAEILKQVREGDVWKERVASENKAVEQLRAGMYWKNS